MRDVTGWAAVTWLRWTVALAVLVGLAWWLLPAGSGTFVIVCVVAAVVELYVTRQLGREWIYEARYRWWWAR